MVVGNALALLFLSIEVPEITNPADSIGIHSIDAVINFAAIVVVIALAVTIIALEMIDVQLQGRLELLQSVVVMVMEDGGEIGRAHV